MGPRRHEVAVWAVEATMVVVALMREATACPSAALAATILGVEARLWLPVPVEGRYSISATQKLLLLRVLYQIDFLEIRFKVI